MVSGMKANNRRSIGTDDGPKMTLVNLVRCHYDDGLDVLIDPFIYDQVNSLCFRIFMRIVFRCISLKLEDSPTMKRIIKRIEEAQDIQNQHKVASTIATQSPQRQNLESYRISLKEINLAIEDFSQQTPIGDGGYEHSCFHFHDFNTSLSVHSSSPHHDHATIIIFGPRTTPPIHLLVLSRII
ncbi:unnamed protein product [Lactuca virosa]|uniref:Uncharacterized protein n=1 Tax=Lactuca virosa TaxID=75947 RepID=A0AAU9PLJ3_9ASTR|nr:unnamed protein product [Lactuca virosa]